MNEQVWRAVQECLDAREDPWTDGSVRAALAEHPGDVAELRELSRRLQMLAGTPIASTETAIRWFLAAAVALLAVSLYVQSSGSSAPAETPLAEGALSPMNRILSYEVRVVRENADRRAEALRTETQLVRSCEVRTPTLVTDGASFETTILSQRTRIQP